MTTVNIVFRYGAQPTEPAARAISSLREVYGIRRVDFREGDRTVLIEYDSTRLTEPVIHQLLRRAGLDITERLPLFTTPPPPQPAPAT